MRSHGTRIFKICSVVRAWGSWILKFCFIVGSWSFWVCFFCRVILQVLNYTFFVLSWNSRDPGSWLTDFAVTRCRSWISKLYFVVRSCGSWIFFFCCSLVCSQLSETDAHIITNSAWPLPHPYCTLWQKHIEVVKGQPDVTPGRRHVLSSCDIALRR